MTAKAFKQLLENTAAASRDFSLAPAKLPALSEADVTRQISAYLQLRGWKVVRQQSGLFRRLRDEGRIRIGERGCADWYAVRPHPMRGRGITEFFYFELKANGKRATPEQERWLEQHRAIGLECDWFDCLDDFVTWYTQRFA